MNGDKDAVFSRLEHSTNFIYLVLGSIIWLLSIPLILPFGPVTVSLYDATNRCIRLGHEKFFPAFFRRIRRSFKAALPVGTVFILLAFLLLFCIRFSNTLAGESQLWTTLSYIYTGLLFVLCALGFFLFATFTHTEGKAWAIAKAGVILAFRHLYTTITCFLLFVVIVWICLRLPACFLILPGLALLICTMVLEPYFEKESGSSGH